MTCPVNEWLKLYIMPRYLLSNKNKTTFCDIIHFHTAKKQ